MSRDIVERLRALAQHDDLSIGIEAADEIERLRTGLHRVSLASRSSMSSKYECGLIARETLDYKP